LKDKEALVTSLDNNIRSLKSKFEELETKEKTLNNQLEVSSQDKLHFEEVKKSMLENSNTELNKLMNENNTEVEAFRKKKEAAENELQKLKTVKEELICENVKWANEKIENELKLGSDSEDQSKIEDQVEKLR
jgi:dsDNA-specific endonuclease/ATPase MutS2